MKVVEITKLSPHEFTGGKDLLKKARKSNKLEFKDLPGGSGLMYTISKNSSVAVVRIWKLTAEKRRPDVVGELKMERVRWFPIPGAYRVDTITVDEDLRGMGIGKSLYGIVLSIMQCPLLAGYAQTPGGRAMWAQISQIPGVEMKGYFGIHAMEFDKTYEPTTMRSYGMKIDELIDLIMGKIGAEYLGGKDIRYFSFDVLPKTSEQELQAYTKHKLTQIYDNELDISVGLYAIWNP